MDKTPTSNRFGYKSFYRRNLPHIQPIDADLFVTFRLADSLPQHVLQEMREAQVADIVYSALVYRDGKIYRLDAFSIMPNHVHVVFRPLMRGDLPISLSTIMHSLKRNTAKRANSVLERLGTFWAHESFDHYIRDVNEHKRILHYVLQNPVKAGLVKYWQDWPWNYVRAALLADAS
jgi:REP-associated tyrosine transposase